MIYWAVDRLANKEKRYLIATIHMENTGNYILRTAEGTEGRNMGKDIHHANNALIRAGYITNPEEEEFHKKRWRYVNSSGPLPLFYFKPYTYP